MIIVVVMQHGIYESQKVKAANSSGLDNLKKEIEQTQLEGFLKLKIENLELTASQMY